MLLLFVSIACANMLIPSYAAVQLEFHISESLLAIPDAFFVLVSAFFALLWGYYTDRIDRTKVILAGAFSWTIGMMLTASSSSYIMLIISRMLSGAGLGCVLPVGYSIISDAIPPDERSGWFGTLAILSSVSNGVGQALSSFIGPIWTGWFFPTWRFPFFLLSCISIVIVFLLFFVKIPKRGIKEEELIDLVELNLEYSYTISKEDLSKIIKKKTNRYLIFQNFFSIIPGTITIFFLTSMLNLYYLPGVPSEIRLQTATILAGVLGIGYIIGNLILSYLGDVLYRKNKKNRIRLGVICMVLALPFYLTTLLLITPVTSLSISYPSPQIPPNELTNYIFQTLGKIFSEYPNYIYYFIFGLIGTILIAGPVANRNAAMIDVNLPEHRGTSVSFLNLSEQVGKSMTLFASYFLISFLGGIYNMMFFSMFFWIPACILWFFASRNVGKDLTTKSMILSERKQVSLLDYIFELEIQMDRAIQKIQDSKYYIVSNPQKFNQLISDAIKIFTYCEKEGEFRSITNIVDKARDLNIKATSIKITANQIYELLQDESVIEKERELLSEDLKQMMLKIAEGEKSTFGELQIYYEDASLKIIEARLVRKNDLLKTMQKIQEAIIIYQRVKNLLNERVEILNGTSDLSKEDQLVYEKERELLEKCSKSLRATKRLNNEFQGVFKQLEENGISKNDLEKISELTLEFNVNLDNIINDTFGKNKDIKKVLNKIFDKIDTIFNEYDKWKEAELKVF